MVPTSNHPKYLSFQFNIDVSESCQWHNYAEEKTHLERRLRSPGPFTDNHHQSRHLAGGCRIQADLLAQIVD